MTIVKLNSEHLLFPTIFRFDIYLSKYPRVIKLQKSSTIINFTAHISLIEKQILKYGAATTHLRVYFIKNILSFEGIGVYTSYYGY